MFVGAADEELLFCGMAIGHADWDAPVNRLESERMPLDDWLHEDQIFHLLVGDAFTSNNSRK